MHDNVVSGAAIADRLDRLPLSGWHRRMVLLIGLGSFFSFFEVALGSFLGTLLGAGWKLTTVDTSTVIGSAFVGEMIGSLLLAPLADRVGRRTMFQVNLIAYAAMSLATAFAPNLPVFLALRVLTGIGLGAELTLVDTYLSELLPARRRGRYVAWSYTFALTAAPVAGILAKSATGTLFGLDGWRWLLILAAGGGLVAWLSRRRLPESPRWLASVGRTAEAEALVSGIERQATAQGVPLPAPTPAPAIPVPEGGQGGVRLLQAPLLSRLVVGCVSLMVVNTLIYGFITWLPTFFIGQGQSVTRSTAFALLMALGGPVGSTLGAIAADLLGRKPTIIGAASAAVLLSAAFALSGDPILTAAIGFLLTIPIYALVAALFAGYIPELFPTGVRLRGVGICNAAGRSASIVVPLFIGPIFARYGVGGVLGLMAAALIVMIIVVAWLGVEPQRKGAEAAAPAAA